MTSREPIEVDGDESDEVEYVDRREILAPAIYDTIAALGGYEGPTYVLGDEAYGCLKDLKKYWRKDDTDDERTVARIFWEARVLPNDLVPIILETAGKGLVEHKCAVACADIVTAMTWPIDMAEELKELDEELDKGTDYTQLLQSHLYYKAALLKPGVIQALLGVMLPCIAKDKKERTERDVQIVNVVLHLFRNLAFIKDVPPNVHASSDQAEFSTLQSRLIETMSKTHVFDLLLTMASNAASDAFFNQWNTLIMEIFYLLFRGVSPQALAIDQTKRSQGSLSLLLEQENKAKLENARKASSRHSRFGTTISVRLNTNKTQPSTTDASETDPAQADAASSSTSKAGGSRTFVLHRQRALNDETGNIFDIKKRKMARKTNKVDELSREENLSYEAKVVLRGVARTFIESCHNAFLSSILKDIKSERPKITEKDHIRLLFLVKWCLEFFLAARENQLAEQKKGSNTVVWSFDLVGEVLERGWIVWILKRMREAVEEKPKLWTELQAGLECLTQLLQLIDSMSTSPLTSPTLTEAAELLQQQLVYNGEVLDIAVESLRSYKEGVQSLQYLDSSVRMAYTLLRMLERWSRRRGGEVYVRKKKAARRGKKKESAEGGAEGDEEEAAGDAQDQDEEPVIHETMFSFEAFEIKFAHEDITHTLLAYLARYTEFTSPEQMKRVVNLLHRQAVKAKAEGLFFKVSTLNLFKNILAKQGSLPTDQAYKDLINLINYILKKFFKQLAENPMLAVEAFFPKNRSLWKKYSSWEPEVKESKRGRVVEEDSTFPPDVQVKKGYTWSEQLAIAIACLQEDGKQELIKWVKEILTLVISQRHRIIEETDGSATPLDSASGDNAHSDSDDEGRAKAIQQNGPSKEAFAKFEDYLIPYVNDEHADAATKNPHLKLVFRLIKFQILDENADELEWYAPASILPADLQRSLSVITQFESNPIDLNGRSPSELLTKARRRRRRRRSPSQSGSDANSDNEDEDDSKRKKRKKKAKEKQAYKSAQFIEDSDVEYGDDEAFWAREREHRARTAKAAAAAEGAASEATAKAPMRSSGTKKRKKTKRVEKEWEGGMFQSAAGDDEDATNEDTEQAKKRARVSSSDDERESAEESSASDRTSSDSEFDVSSEAGKTARRKPDTPVTTPSEASAKTTIRKTKTVKRTGDGKSASRGVAQKVSRTNSKPKQPRRPRPAYDASVLQASPIQVSDNVQEGMGASNSGPLFLGDDGGADEDGNNQDLGEKGSNRAPQPRVSRASSTPLFLSDDKGERDFSSGEAASRKPRRGIVISDDEDE